MGPVSEYVDRAVVDTDGLNLRSKSGQSTLEQRVRKAAYDICDRLTVAQLSSETQVGMATDCATAAVEKAQPEVKQAIAAAA